MSEQFFTNIKPEEQILYLCTRQNFQHSHCNALLDVCSQNNINWQAVYAIAQLHGVAPLVYVNLRQTGDLNIPSEVLEQLKISLMRNMMLKSRFETEIARAVAFFKEKSIHVMLVKGAALDILVYNQPYYTVYNDVDLVLDLKREEISDRVYKEFMSYFGGRGVEYDYFSHHDVTMNDTLPIDFQQIWQDASPLEFKGQEMLVMSPEDMLLSLCVNSCRKRFFRLKTICDIAETINKYPDLDWDKFAQQALEYECQFIVYTALLITKMTVGCSVPAEVLEKFKINPARIQIIHYLSRQMDLSSFSSLYSDKNLFGRHVDWSLLLSYATFHPVQAWRRCLFVLRFTERGMPRTR